MEGTTENTAPPAALLEPEEQDTEDDTELQFDMVQLATTMADAIPEACTTLEIFKGCEVAL